MSPLQPFLLWWKPALEICILWFLIYHSMLFFEGTRAMHVLRGIIILMLAFLLFQQLQLHILYWLLNRFFAVSILAVLILFHPEIRQGLARLGQQYFFGSALREEEIDFVLREVLSASEHLSRIKTGALIAIANRDPLSAYAESGIALDARVSAELLQTIFTPNSLLHDGAVVIVNGRIAAGGCLFPLSEKQDLSRIYGTRHRAALGLSEATDAFVIVVSEERQEMSLAYRGVLYKYLNKADLFTRIKEITKLRKTRTKER